MNNQFMQSDLLQYLKRSLRAQNAKPDKIKTYHRKIGNQYVQSKLLQYKTKHRERNKTHENVDTAHNDLFIRIKTSRNR